MLYTTLVTLRARFQVTAWPVLNMYMQRDMRSFNPFPSINL